MTQSQPLENLISLERQAEILDLLSPREFAVVVLRLEFGLSDAEIGREFGLTHRAIAQRRYNAQDKILAHCPELRRYAGVRSRARGSA
jgi:DNA-directed RNA polymerase specialized sigma24 family protein